MSQEDLTKWEINGTTLVLDIDDIGDLERYERAFKQMGEAAKQIPKDGTASEITKAYCKTFYDMYDCIFGSGTAEKIHQKKYSAAECETVYASFLAFVSAQRTARDAARAQIARYLPQNRAQRRRQK